ncbi:MAG: metallophosphoesterase [Chlorobiota bacterium]|nr:metallophosphoesterase [Chlorobiota bacterium]QQS65625.1 MAG: metallophosphoesterase [Chlorobiota bacterium]
MENLNRRSFFKWLGAGLTAFLSGLWGCTQGIRESLLTVWNERGGASEVFNAKSVPPAIPFSIPNNIGIRFIVFGDWGMGDYNQLKVAKAMSLTAKQFGCDYIISTGDNFYPTGVTGIEDEQWTRKFTDIYKKNGLNQVFYPALGNHDYYGNERAEIEYSKINPQWYLPNYYYSKLFNSNDGSNVELFVIDSDLVNAENDEFTLKQSNWLERQLKGSNAKWKIVVGHHPVYSNGFHNTSQIMINTFEALFVKYNVNLYMCGHNHEVHLLKPKKGVTYLVSGGGCTHHNTTWKDDTEYALTNLGYVWMNFNKESINIQIHDSVGRVKFAHKIT